MMLTGEITRVASSDRSVLKILDMVFACISEWAVPHAELAAALRSGPPDTSLFIIYAALIPICAGIILTFLWKHKNSTILHPVYIFGLYSFMYISCLVVIMGIINVGIYGVEPRYLTPLYIPILSIFLVLLDRIIKTVKTTSCPRTIQWTVISLVFCFLFSWLASHIPAQYQVITAKNNGSWSSLGYAGPAWSEYRILQHIRREYKNGQTIYANNIALVYLYARKFKKYRHMPYDLEDLRKLLENTAHGTILVWFSCCDWGHNYGPHDLRSLGKLDKVSVFEGGFIFRVNS